MKKNQKRSVYAEAWFKKAMAAALALAGLAISAEAAQGPQPAGICNRACWAARAPTCGISQMASLNRAIIHHTAGASDYSTDLNTSKAKVRGVQNIHINNGWCDIAYHFLVDGAGNIFEGRSGSMSGLPRGTHDSYNVNSFGFNMLGYFHPPYNHPANPTLRSRLYDVIAWRMPSAWSPYGAGTYNGVSVGYLDGHRKVKATACPGDGMWPYIGDNRSGGEARNEVNARKSGCNIGMTQGSIRARYEALGGCGGPLGAPTTYETATPDGVGRFNHFANSSSIYWHPNTGAWDVRGAIRAHWASIGWEQSGLGYPTTGDTPTPTKPGYFNHFQGGSIYWSAATGAQNVRGAIREKWASLGWEQSFLGFPTTSDAATPGNTGYFNHFEGGSIYWSGATGAWSVRGAIRDKWASLGWEQSCHGFPISDEYAWNGGARSDFQNGYIYWTPTEGAISSCGVNPPPLVDKTVDNAEAGFSVTGTWTAASSATDKFGADYRFRSTAAVSEPAIWQTDLSAAGSYVVSAWWAQGSNRSAGAPYVVYHSAGTTTVNVNQQVNGGRWNSLGTFNLNSGANQVRLSCWAATGFIVLADAIRWQQQ